MRRALILIIVLTVGTFGFGWWLDHQQQQTAENYMEQIAQVRQSVLEDHMERARREEAFLHASWQQDSRWLNCLVDHHHTRDISGALLKLATALEMNWQDQALLAVDEALDALEEVAQNELPKWENIL